jgi:SRSO17 transposase
VDKSISKTVAAAHSVSAGVWQGVLDEVLTRIGGRFARVEPRATAGDLLLALLAPLERKNCWWLAEHAGHATPYRMQRLLRDAVWDHDQVRDDLRDLVTEHLRHPEAVLVVDETGFLKKGTASAGVQRQYCGTAGRIENSQVGVFLAYASPLGRALLDRRLYVPRSWSDDPDRCAAAGIPHDTEFATKPLLALHMLTAALAAGIAAGWVTADEAYGRDPLLRAALREQGIGYVLAVARNHYTQVTTTVKERVDVTESWLSSLAWQRRSCGPGSKGERYYDWAWVSIHDDGPGLHSLLIRRNSAGELAFYRCWSPGPVPLATLVRVAGARWAVEETFQQAKGQVGLDHYQRRGWTAWHRFTILAMLALAMLTIVAISQRDTAADLVAITVPEARRLINAFHLGIRHAQLNRVIAWSRWRRRHQAQARASHYKRRYQLELSRP